MCVFKLLMGTFFIFNIRQYYYVYNIYIYNIVCLLGCVIILPSTFNVKIQMLVYFFLLLFYGHNYENVKQ